MRESRDRGLDSIERQLVTRSGVAAPAGHRDRVLAAVRDALGRRPGPPPQTGIGIDADCRAVLVAMALSATLVIVAPWVAVATSVAPTQAEPRLVAQARAAGIEMPLELVATIDRPPQHVSPTGEPLSARPRENWHLRNLLMGEL